MEIVIFGDTHGNIVALEKLVKLELNKVDLFISHGDVVNYGPWSNECVELLDSIPNCIRLKGNHEQYYINGYYPGENVIAKSFFENCHNKFDENLIKKISDYQEEYGLIDYKVRHTINDKYYFKDTSILENEIDENYIIGHSHQQFYRKIKDKKLINTGSIGQNREFINLSCYVKLNTETKQIKLLSYDHDIDKVINEMKIQKYPEICIDYYLSKKRINI
ncbi:metallophosphoesterase [Flavobacterium oreochromis]|uniref:Metallophosphoesterase n=1 Tax=Flavobacterium oreochromis TaxID=2906078 RepID=A0ABW8P7Z5_9FLAO|nr:metallophosphoesterase [Flavobacterium oreochromis]OWP77583.1 metallophosphoesterase [Flavobacterium oreochromis]